MVVIYVFCIFYVIDAIQSNDAINLFDVVDVVLIVDIVIKIKVVYLVGVVYVFGAIRSDRNIKCVSIVKFYKKVALLFVRYEFNDISRGFNIQKTFSRFLLFKVFIGFNIEELGFQK